MAAYLQQVCHRKGVIFHAFRRCHRLPHPTSWPRCAFAKKKIKTFKKKRSWGGILGWLSPFLFVPRSTGLPVLCSQLLEPLWRNTVLHGPFAPLISRGSTDGRAGRPMEAPGAALGGGVRHVWAGPRAKGSERGQGVLNVSGERTILPLRKHRHFSSFCSPLQLITVALCAAHWTCHGKQGQQQALHD